MCHQNSMSITLKIFGDVLQRAQDHVVQRLDLFINNGNGGLNIKIGVRSIINAIITSLIMFAGYNLSNFMAFGFFFILFGSTEFSIIKRER